MKNKKKRGLLICFISLFIIFTFLVFFVIGLNSNKLVNNAFKWISFILTMFGIFSFSYGLILATKAHRRRGFKKLKTAIFTIFIFIYISGCIAFLTLLYGPYKGFREWLITTAMATMNHHYLCEWFYNDEVINDVLGNNYIDDGDAETDTSLIKHEETVHYENDYERQVLEREKNQLYKVVTFDFNGCNAFLGVVYDSTKIKVGVTPKLGTSGYYIHELAKRYNAALAINGGGFMDGVENSSGGNPVGITISDGNIITNRPVGGAYGVIGFDNKGNLILTKRGNAQSLIDEGIREAVTMGPFLIVNGNPSFVKGDGGWGIAARTAIGQRKDGIVLFLVVDSNGVRTKGATMRDLVDIMQKYGAINAANLDGGTSSTMALREFEASKYSICEGEKCCSTSAGEKYCIINKPIDSALKKKSRPIPTIFNVVE